MSCKQCKNSVWCGGKPHKNKHISVEWSASSISQSIAPASGWMTYFLTPDSTSPSQWTPCSILLGGQWLSSVSLSCQSWVCITTNFKYLQTRLNVLKVAKGWAKVDWDESWWRWKSIEMKVDWDEMDSERLRGFCDSRVDFATEK